MADAMQQLSAEGLAGVLEQASSTLLSAVRGGGGAGAADAVPQALTGFLSAFDEARRRGEEGEGGDDGTLQAAWRLP